MKDFFKLLSAIVLAGIVLIGGYYGVIALREVQKQHLGVAVNQWVYPESPIVGTKVGTSTTGIAFGGATAATSSYVVRIGKNKQFANLTILPTAVTSSADAWITLSLEGSNDNYCWVSSSTASDVNTGDINWYPIMDNLKDKVHATSLSGATSTLVWATPALGESENVLLENMNYECLRVWVGAQSSTIYAGIATK